MTDIAGNLRRILERIEGAAKRAGRPPNSVRLLAVTKTVALEHIHQAIACGVTQIAENRLQEALSKREPLAGEKLTWHFIGHLQTNKAKKVVQNFDCVHSVDRAELAEALARQVSNRPPLPVLIEVKLQDEPNKSGVAEGDLPGLVAAVKALQSLNLRGLMAIPPPVEDPEQARPFFRRLRVLAQDMGLSELSMGMTDDFEVAVEEGATMVRIGTGLFGSRL
jgi:pyridoxal phosphate enzyme (YggS family)